MCVLEVLATIETISRRECATLHFVIDVLHIHEAAFRQVDIDAGTQEFLHEQRHIELIAVEAREVAVLETCHQFVGNFLESRTVFYVLVRDAMNGGRYFRNVNRLATEIHRTQAHVFRFLIAVGQHLDITKLHNIVLAHIETRGFDVEEDKWPRKIQFH